jgi:Tripartite tricarboxylate transporter family receptor
MKRLRVEQDRSLIGHPDTWTVIEHRPGVGSSVVFRGTYRECLKRAEEIANARPRWCTRAAIMPCLSSEGRTLTPKALAATHSSQFDPDCVRRKNCRVARNLSLATPTGTPDEVVEKLNAATTASVTGPDLKSRLLNLGIEPMPMSVANFRKFVTDEIAKYAKVIQFAGVKVE